MREERSFGFVIAHRTDNSIRYLLVRQLTHWSFPKGHKENDEEPLDTAKRELFEECGISYFRLLPDVSYKEEYVFDRDGQATNKTNEFFVALVDSEEIHPQPAEILECAFADFETASAMLTYESQKNILTKVDEFLRSTT